MFNKNENSLWIIKVIDFFRNQPKSQSDEIF